MTNNAIELLLEAARREERAACIADIARACGVNLLDYEQNHDNFTHHEAAGRAAIEAIHARAKDSR